MIMKDSRFKFFVELFVPILLLVGLYVITDPYKMIYHYDSYYNASGPSYVGLDNDYVSTTNFDNHNHEFHYNSFIFGNSRSRYYMVNDWRQHLDSSAMCYRFDASNETLLGVYRKLKYASRHAEIKNCLLVFDASILATVNNPVGSHLFTPAPQTTEERDWLSFQLAGFKTFCNPKFILAYMDLKLFGQIRGYMKRWNTFNLDSKDYDYRHNEITYPDRELQIDDGTYYDERKMKDWFNQRPQSPYEGMDCIGEEQKHLLHGIDSIFTQHNTNYKIIISPCFDQVELSINDRLILESIFGAKSVFDFSGKNEFTEDYHNYYDCNHYRPCIAKAVLDSIYR